MDSCAEDRCTQNSSTSSARHDGLLLFYFTPTRTHMKMRTANRILHSERENLTHPDYRVRQQALGRIFDETLENRPTARIIAAKILLDESDREDVQRRAVAQMAEALIIRRHGHRRIMEHVLDALEKPQHPGVLNDLMDLLPALTVKGVPLPKMPRHVTARLLDRLRRTASGPAQDGRHPGVPALVGLYHLSKNGPRWCRQKADAIIHDHARNTELTDVVRSAAVGIVLASAADTLDKKRRLDPRMIRTLKQFDHESWIADSQYWAAFYHVKRRAGI